MSDIKSATESSRPSWYFRPGPLIAIVTSVWSAWLIVAMCGFVKGVHLDRSQMGPFGDFFGVVNSLFTALAIIGVALTYHLQQEQMRRQDLANRIQSREQLLSARLNAEAALLDSFRAQGEAAKAHGRHYTSLDAYAHSKGCRHRIGLLKEEIQLGWERDRDSAFDREILSKYVRQLIKNMVTVHGW